MQYRHMMMNSVVTGESAAGKADKCICSVRPAGAGSSFASETHFVRESVRLSGLLGEPLAPINLTLY